MESHWIVRCVLLAFAGIFIMANMGAELVIYCALSAVAFVFIMFATLYIIAAYDQWFENLFSCADPTPTNDHLACDRHSSSTKHACADESNDYFTRPYTPKKFVPYWNDPTYIEPPKGAVSPRRELSQEEKNAAIKWRADREASEVEAAKLAESKRLAREKKDLLDRARDAAKASLTAAAARNAKANAMTAETFSERLRALEAQGPLSRDDIEMRQLRALAPHLKRGLIGRRDDGLWLTQPLGYEPMLIDITSGSVYSPSALFSSPNEPYQAVQSDNNAPGSVRRSVSDAPSSFFSSEHFKRYQDIAAPSMSTEQGMFAESSEPFQATQTIDTAPKKNPFGLPACVASMVMVPDHAAATAVVPPEPARTFESPALSVPAKGPFSFATVTKPSQTQSSRTTEAATSSPAAVTADNPILKVSDPGDRRAKAKGLCASIQKFARLNRTDPDGSVEDLEGTCAEFRQKMNWVKEYLEASKTPDGAFIPILVAPHQLKPWGLGLDVWSTIKREMGVLCQDPKWGNGYLGQTLAVVLQVDEAMKGKGK
ncbi:hypothetical protein TI39_contig475g00012 [Zymoseptoria brevis]|uniref:Uncharacterized protein n=1 Tax=Zymoseptoria brevis TaxID=1047168 RepID=A0A0F4GJQ3_9PEZI|nr:hypothetical protein TI39_contig475g00012 [Zymoseptoria brevis]